MEHCWWTCDHDRISTPSHQHGHLKLCHCSILFNYLSTFCFISFQYKVNSCVVALISMLFCFFFCVNDLHCCSLCYIFSPHPLSQYHLLPHLNGPISKGTLSTQSSSYSLALLWPTAALLKNYPWGHYSPFDYSCHVTIPGVSYLLEEMVES